MLTASPITVYSSRRSDPMLPANTSPKLIPMPMPSSGRPSLFHLAFIFSSSASWSTAQLIARSASSSCAIGAPHSAMIASPMNLSSVPECSNTISTISVKYSVSRVAISSGPMVSESGVKPRMSEKKITTGRFWPPSCTAPSCWAICDARFGAK